MKIDDILKVLLDVTKNDTQEDLIRSRAGLSASEIADKLALLRSNVSADLQRLYKQGLVIKAGTKAIYYYPMEKMKKLTYKDIPVPCSVDSFAELLEEEVASYIPDAFNKMIGREESLQQCVTSAKAAVLYPSTPLNILLLGESGTGKSFFAENIYSFGKQEGIFREDSNFIVFNCADYASNSQLLLSQLFGSAKGAYTGADESRMGLIERADHGVLFLDEVHRLPPEGQEMLFYFIDKKKFRRLGEGNCERFAEVFLIMATTEDPGSHLLGTFMRRIPMVIHMPNMAHKGLHEKFELVCQLLEIEANAIQRNIHIEKTAMMPLLLYQPQGNIGQLKNDIKLAVARSYLEMKNKRKEHLYILKEALSYSVISSLENMDIMDRKAFEVLLHKDEYCIHCNQNTKLRLDTIHPFMERHDEQREDFKTYIDNFSLKLDDKTKLAGFLDEETIEIMSYVHEWLFYNLHILIDETQNVALALYFNSIKGQLHATIDSVHVPYSLPLYEKAVQLVKILETRFSLYFSKQEIIDLTNMLDTIANNQKKDHSYLLFVSSHGDSLATNIANVVNELLSSTCVIPIDMPLTENAKVVTDKIVNILLAYEEKKEVLIFVDMGSLSGMETVIMDKTIHNVSIIPSNNILLVLETARKAIILGKDKYSIINDLIHMNNRMARDFSTVLSRNLSLNNKKIIYTICRSGEGTAHYLERYLKQLLKENDIYDIEVLALSYNDVAKIRRMIMATSKDKEILAIVGNVNPMLEEYPYISIDEILMQHGIERIISYANKDLKIKEDSLGHFNRDIVISVSFDAIDKYLYYLDSKKLMPLITNFINGLESAMQMVIDNKIIMKVIIHMSCMIERIAFQKPLKDVDDDMRHFDKAIIVIVRKELERIESLFSIQIPNAEVLFLLEIFEFSSCL